jgi:hypothetical protein
MHFVFLHVQNSTVFSYSEIFNVPSFYLFCSDFKDGIDPNVTYMSAEPDLLESLFTNQNDNALIDRLLGCAYGQALGDAYGLSTEFETRKKVARNYPNASTLIPFPNYISTDHSKRWNRGDWTDDTDQWILVLETLTEGNGDEKIFAKKLKRWIEFGFRELGDMGGMGLGANVQKVIDSTCFCSFVFVNNNILCFS